MGAGASGVAVVRDGRRLQTRRVDAVGRLDAGVGLVRPPQTGPSVLVQAPLVGVCLLVRPDEMAPRVGTVGEVGAKAPETVTVGAALLVGLAAEVLANVGRPDAALAGLVGKPHTSLPTRPRRLAKVVAARGPEMAVPRLPPAATGVGQTGTGLVRVVVTLETQVIDGAGRLVTRPAPPTGVPPQVAGVVPVIVTVPRPRPDIRVGAPVGIVTPTRLGHGRPRPPRLVVAVGPARGLAGKGVPEDVGGGPRPPGAAEVVVEAVGVRAVALLALVLAVARRGRPTPPVDALVHTTGTKAGADGPPRLRLRVGLVWVHKGRARAAHVRRLFRTGLAAQRPVRVVVVGVTALAEVAIGLGPALVRPARTVAATTLPPAGPAPATPVTPGRTGVRRETPARPVVTPMAPVVLAVPRPARTGTLGAETDTRALALGLPAPGLVTPFARPSDAPSRTRADLVAVLGPRTPRLVDINGGVVRVGLLGGVRLPPYSAFGGAAPSVWSSVF